MDIFLEENDYVDFSSDNVSALSHKLFDSLTDNGERIRAAYGFVDTQILTARISARICFLSGRRMC